MSRLHEGKLLLALLAAATLAGCKEPVDLCHGVRCDHGTCEVADGMATCRCAAGYQGALCNACAPGYKQGADGACTWFGGCAVENPCQHGGTCDDASGTVACTCPKGYAGAHCERCAAAFHDDGTGQCVADAACLPNTCSGHGACTPTGATLTCACESAYTGAYCESCATGFHRDPNGGCAADEVCSDGVCRHGACETSRGVIVCACERGWAGARCDTCAPGFHAGAAGACALDQQCLPSTCSGHGECSAAGGLVSCACDDGYAGSSCGDCDTGFHRTVAGTCEVDQTCTANVCGHGTCDASTGVIHCACALGWAGDRCAACAAGYHSDGDGACGLDQQCLATSCSGHGACTVTGGVVACACEDGYAGAFCETCEVGFHRDPLGLCKANESCDPNPCAHGSCSNASGVAACSCEAGYGGARCELCAVGYHRDGEVCALDQVCQADSCSGHGTCTNPGGKVRCACEVGYAGATCGECYEGYERSFLNQRCQIPCSGPEYIRCGGACVSGYAHDTCGDCDAACTPSEQCRREPASGAASCFCPADQHHAVCSGGACADLRIDENNCGACGNACDLGDKCIAGACQANDATCTAGGACTGESDLCCNGECLAGAAWNDRHCGGCGMACGESEFCQVVAGIAACVCPVGDAYRRDCPGDSCVNVFEDELNCGGCGTQCAPGETCILGTCRAEDASCGSCPEGTFCCGATCLDFSAFARDEQNCGGCGIGCSGGICAGGRCATSVSNMCMMLKIDSNICCSPLPEGTNPLVDGANCGGCGRGCGENQLCEDGACRCRLGVVCGDDCPTLDWSNEHCGACGHSCNLAAGQRCVMGRCADSDADCGGSCTDHQLCCQGPSGPGCVWRTAVLEDPNHCGGCSACSSGQTCQGGVCH